MDDDEVITRIPTGARPTMLYSERPLTVSPELAAVIGLNEALLLQQLQYWLARSKHEHDGQRWVYNTFEEWQCQFPFWTEKTLQRIMGNLVNAKLVIVKRFNRQSWDRTNWYAINYDNVHALDYEGQRILAAQEAKKDALAQKRREQGRTTLSNVSIPNHQDKSG